VATSNSDHPCFLETVYKYQALSFDVVRDPVCPTDQCVARPKTAIADFSIDALHEWRQREISCLSSFAIATGSAGINLEFDVSPRSVIFVCNRRRIAAMVRSSISVRPARWIRLEEIRPPLRSLTFDDRTGGLWCVP
jgi:hypothetical protein